VDRRGLPTTDAAAALGDDGVANLLAIGGGFKGCGRAHPPAAEHEEVPIPGDRGHIKMAAALAGGEIEVADQLAKELEELASTAS